MRRIQTHKRINDTFTGPVERPVLAWLASKMPAWVTPDLLTAFGLFGTVMIFFGYCLTFFDPNFLWLASLGFVINWFGDSLDGTLARYRNIQRPIYGFFVDHASDSASIVLVFLGLGISPYVQFNYASLALVGYLLLSILVYLRTCVNGEFKISYIKLGPTEMRLIAIGGNIIVYVLGNPIIHLLGTSFSIYDLIALGVAALLFGAFLVSSAVQAARLSKIDQPAKRPVIAEPEQT